MIAALRADCVSDLDVTGTTSVKISIAVDATGRTTSVQPFGGSKRLEQCIRASLLRITYTGRSASLNGMRFKVTQPPRERRPPPKTGAPASPHAVELCECTEYRCRGEARCAAG